jgi:hypothetical protein
VSYAASEVRILRRRHHFDLCMIATGFFRPPSRVHRGSIEGLF